MTLTVFPVSDFFLLVGTLPVFVAEELLRYLDNLLPVYFFAAFAIKGIVRVTVPIPIAETITGLELHEKSNDIPMIKAPNFIFLISVFMTFSFYYNTIYYPDVCNTNIWL